MAHVISAEARNNPVLAPVIKDLDYANHLVIKGWTHVDYPHGFNGMWEIKNVEAWCEKHTHQYWRCGRTFYFKKESDAAMFLLKYL